MNPIVAAIMATLEAKHLSPAYHQLQARLTQKFGANSDVVKAWAALEAKPTSFVRREQLIAELQATQAHQDPDLLALAATVTHELELNQSARQFVAAFITPSPRVEAAPSRDYAKEFSQAFLLPEPLRLLPATIPDPKPATKVPSPTLMLPILVAASNHEAIPPTEKPALTILPEIPAEEDEEADLDPIDDATLRLSLKTLVHPRPLPQPTPLTAPPATASPALPVAPKMVNIYTTVAPAPPVDLTLLDAALYDLAKLPTDTIPEISPLPRGSRMPIEPNPLFHGRNHELRTVAKQLKTHKLIIITQVETTLIGAKPQITSEFGGMGKTHLASEFVHRYGQYFAGGVFWLNFADPQNVALEVIASGAAAATQLRADFRNMLLEDQQQLILSAWQSPLPRLLIFDNCDDPELLARWCPLKGGSHVLVTSRHTHWSEFPQAVELRLEVLTETEGLALLRQYRPDPMVSDSDMEAIAAELGYLPLALHLAGSHLITYRHETTPARYRKRLHKFNLAKYPALKSLNQTQHDYHIIRTLMLSYEQLDSSDPTDILAQALLLRAAFFAPNAVIPRDLLLSTLQAGSARHPRRDFWGKVKGFLSVNNADDLLPRAKEAVARLVMLGLLELAQDGALYLHQVLSQALRLLAKGTGTQALVRQTFAETSQLLKQSGSPTVLLTWQVHLQAQDSAEDEALNLPGPFGQHFLEQNGAPWEQTYYERALAINEQLMGENHPDTAQSLDNLGVWATYQGDLMRARFYYERSLAIRLAALSETHADTARSFNNYGALLVRQGSYQQAQDYYNKALTIRQTIFGLYHPDTAQSLHNLGELAYQQEQYAEAQRYFEQALTIYTEVLGPHHAETGRSWGNLAATQEAQGDYETAQAAYETAWHIFCQVLGETHPDTATILNNLGSLLETRGTYSTAALYYEEALAIREAVLGPQHPDTASSLHNLGVLQAHTQHWESAAELLRQALTLRQTTLGARHPHTLLSQEALSSVEAHLQKRWQPQVIKPALRQAA